MYPRAGSKYSHQVVSINDHRVVVTDGIDDRFRLLVMVDSNHATIVSGIARKAQGSQIIKTKSSLGIAVVTYQYHGDTPQLLDLPSIAL